jgi:hypothetical protein
MARLRTSSSPCRFLASPEDVNPSLSLVIVLGNLLDTPTESARSSLAREIESVTGYRDGLCLFCDGTRRETCRRCQAAVCPTHALDGGAWCAVCAKELKDEVDVATFGVAVNDVAPGSSIDVFNRPNPFDVLGTLVRRSIVAVRARSAKRRARRAFDSRSPSEIAEWRRMAGVWMRATGG